MFTMIRQAKVAGIPANGASLAMTFTPATANAEPAKPTAEKAARYVK